jgi:predicted ATPase with chaperone activity
VSSTIIALPQTVEETGIRRNLLEDLALKILYLEGELSLLELAEKMRVNLAIAEELFQRLRKEQLCEVKGLAGSVYRVVTTSLGKTRAIEYLSLNQYAGPAPVSLPDYVSRVRAQSVRNSDVHPPDVERAFEHLVLSQHTLAQLGAAAVSGTSIFLYGPTGTGKTAIAETLPRIYQDQVWIPHAVEIDGQIITVYDSGVHERLEPSADEESDARWVLCRRPRVVTGGELTIDMLDLQFNPVAKFYAAPIQMKANNGVLIIDDFGRQRMRPEEMLNRWIVPLDRHIDFLTLAGGKKFEIPFDLFVVFATNLDPAKLADDAFMRRIQNKIKVDYVTREQFHEICRRVSSQFHLTYDEAVVEHLIDILTRELSQPLRACYPRDILQQICSAARYEGKPPRLDQSTVAQACGNYFLLP